MARLSAVGGDIRPRDVIASAQLPVSLLFEVRSRRVQRRVEVIDLDADDICSLGAETGSNASRDPTRPDPTRCHLTRRDRPRSLIALKPVTLNNASDYQTIGLTD